MQPLELLSSLLGRDPGPEPIELPMDTTLHLVSNERRRLVIDYVDTLGPMEVGALADAIASVTESKRKSTYIALYQDHLPKLDRRDVIDLGPRGHHVEPGPHFDAFVDLLEDLDQRFDTEGDSETELEFDENDAAMTIGGETA
ncbi:hypothetical protein [Natrinema sp. DC36]|uniref:DUF7344 domain-containing protein n=1 Tax=Natrinema sp. DC36 TaxID=2878680 RepID=UPI001CF0842D|nr:hypothetical protein [Natrinema sp. DC36]